MNGYALVAILAIVVCIMDYNESEQKNNIKMAVIGLQQCVVDRNIGSSIVWQKECNKK
jgi:hypothetical protein